MVVTIITTCDINWNCIKFVYENNSFWGFSVNVWEHIFAGKKTNRRTNYHHVKKRKNVKHNETNAIEIEPLSTF